MSLTNSSLRLRPSILCLLILTTYLCLTADAGAGGIQQATEPTDEPTGLVPTPSPGAVLTFAVADATLSPGSTGQILIRTLEALPLSEGSLALRFDPPVFSGNPVLVLGPAAPDGFFTLSSPSSGTYLIGFEASSAPLNATPGAFISLTGAVRGDLPAGSLVSVGIEARAKSPEGRPLNVQGLGRLLWVAAEIDELVLHVNGVSGLTPGDTVKVEISTYNPKPISQGQVCLHFDPGVFTKVRWVSVLGAEPDVSFSADLSMPGVVEITFTSPSASVNRFDGAMITVGLALSPSLPPGLETTVEIEESHTFLMDHLQQVVPLSTESGEFRIAD